MSNDTAGMGTGATLLMNQGFKIVAQSQANGNNNRKAPTNFFYDHPAVKDHKRHSPTRFNILMELFKLSMCDESYQRCWC